MIVGLPFGLLSGLLQTPLGLISSLRNLEIETHFPFLTKTGLLGVSSITPPCSVVVHEFWCVVLLVFCLDV